MINHDIYVTQFMMDAPHHRWHASFWAFPIMQEYARNLRAIGIDAREIESFRALWQCVAPRDKQDNIQFWCKEQFEYIKKVPLCPSMPVDTSRVRLGGRFGWFIHWILIAVVVSFWAFSSGIYKDKSKNWEVYETPSCSKHHSVERNV